jgi:SAM-dependent methyltransferase
MWQKQLAAYRTRALAGAYGRVLEIGIGSGLNLPFYGHGVKRVLGIDPSPELIRLAEKAAGNASFSVEFLIQSARGNAAREGQHRHGRHDLDHVHHSRSGESVARGATGVEAGRAPDLCRARSRAGAQGGGRTG